VTTRVTVVTDRRTMLSALFEIKTSFGVVWRCAAQLDYVCLCVCGAVIGRRFDFDI
jgi:hypothetical protein